MIGNPSVKEYCAEKDRLGRQRFLAVYSVPVLLAAPPELPGEGNYFTRPKTGVMPSAPSYAQNLGFVVDEGYVVIPIKKAEGRPFPERIGIGRTRGTDILLQSNDISKYHAYFTTEGGDWFLFDANSSNGTFVNGERLPAMSKTAIQDGFLLSFGSRLCMFRSAMGFLDLVESIAFP